MVYKGTFTLPVYHLLQNSNLSFPRLYSSNHEHIFGGLHGYAIIKEQVRRIDVIYVNFLRVIVNIA